MSGWFPGKIALVAKVRAILSDYRADYKEAKHLARRRQVTDETINKLVALFADTGAAPAKRAWLLRRPEDVALAFRTGQLHFPSHTHPL